MDPEDPVGQAGCEWHSGGRLLFRAVSGTGAAQELHLQPCRRRSNPGEPGSARNCRGEHEKPTADERRGNDAMRAYQQS